MQMISCSRERMHGTSCFITFIQSSLWSLGTRVFKGGTKCLTDELI